VEAFGEGRRPQYRVRLGPFADVAAADRAVAAVLAAGLPEVALVVE
jgi:rare lipoprotein A